MTPNFTKKLLVPSFLLLSFIGFSQEVPFTPRLDDGGNTYVTIKGDYISLSNTVMNRRNSRRRDPSNVNDPYNGPDSNNSFHVEYVDIDNDNTTFSSSSSTLSLPDCSRIYYAGLYWAGNYDEDVIDSNYTNTSRPDPLPNDTGRYDYTAIKFKLPGGNYIDLQADNANDPVGEEDEIIIDGHTAATPVRNSPYVCYKNVTGLLQAMTDPQGEYTVANVRGTRGQTNHGAAGWTLVIIYENPTLPGRYISTFDGYEGVTTSSTADQVADIPVVGFNTVPVGNVKARLGASVLEGEASLTGDSFQILSDINRANGQAYTPLFNDVNDVDNFFNSNITEGNAIVTTRNINGTNSMGYDADVFEIRNPAESVIPNNETGATLRLTTSRDWFGAFLVTFGVDIIEPNIVLEKEVWDEPEANNLTGLGVNLGARLKYILSFENNGNDDATNYTIRDVLPVNTFPPNGTATSDFAPGDIIVPPGVTYTYDIPTRTLLFTIPDHLVIEDSPRAQIRINVQVAQNCFDFIDACSNQIENLAYSTYQGVDNPNVITDDPSVSDFNACGFVTPGATNFLLDDLANCNFTRTVQICGNDVTLDAGDGFDTYVWVSDDNGNGLFDATDTVLQNGTSDTLVVTQEGTYIVDKIVRDPCKGFKEVLIVERFGTNTANPIITYFNDSNNDTDVTNDIEGEITECGDDGTDFLSLFLCGTGDSQLLETNLTDYDTISWELLDESSCNDIFSVGCGVTNPCYDYNQVATGGSYTVNDEGKYRLVITYEDGCFDRFYFDVFQNNVTVEATSRDIICTTPGRINVTNPLSGYGFQLVDLTNNTIPVPYSANNGPDFTITTGAVYRVDAVQLNNSGNPIVGGCVFSTNPIPIIERDFQVEVETTPQNCNDPGTIQIDVFNVEPNYTYVLRRRSDGLIIDDETAQAFNRHTFNVNVDQNTLLGEYIIEVTTADGCFYTEDVDVTRIPNPTLVADVTAHIGCSDGTIVLTASDGLPGYSYAIWSKDGPSSYTTIADIPGSEYQGSTFTFASGENGTYEFVVVDTNNCSYISAPVTINDNGPMTLVPTNTPIVCSGTSTASLTIGTSGGVGPFMYSIDDGTTYQSTDTFPNLPAGNYELRVTDSSGCDVQETYLITEPFTLSASAGVTQVVECNPATGDAEVRITNAQGGTAPYMYSFNGGSNFVASNIALLPPGTHNLVIRDAVDCEFPMTVVVPDPVVPPTFTHAIDYECDGEGTITIDPSNTTDFDYTYELNTILNTPANSNVFTDVPSGAQTVTVNYVASAPPVASVLLLEDFGVGPTTSIAGISEIDPIYCYEQQSVATCDTNDRINDLQYAVTNTIENPFGAWVSPNDQDDPANGRYYVLNVGDPGYATIVYAKRGVEIIPNRDISVSLDLINLVTQGTDIIRPNILVELVNSSGTVIASETTGLIPENTGPNNWISFNIPPLDPGANSTIDIVIRTIATGTNGNDVAIDNIEASQMPEICASSVDIPVVIEAGRAFAANILNTTNVSCNGLSDGTITFEVENFDATAGFNYSIDGAAPINSTSSPVTTLPILDAGNHVITIHKADDPSCTTSVNIDITEPDPLIASANIDVALTCSNGATISASAVDGTPTYIYQLEDDLGNIIGAFDFATNGNNNVFTNLPAGDYIVIVRDKNGAPGYCEDPIDIPLTVAPLNPIVFDVTPSNCYSGASDGSIVVNVTSGNGNYQFRIDSGSGPGPWITPAPASATTHTFDNLNDGSYAIEVRDGLGCPLTLPAPQTVVIAPQLNISATAPNITACGTSTDIAITANGGSGALVYAVALTTDPVPTTFAATNPIAVTANGNYIVYVRDNDNNSGAGGTIGADFCQATFPITIVQDAPIVITPTPTDVSCFGGSDGAISIAVDSGGQGPFTYRINGSDAYVIGSDFTNLTAGTYPVQVRDVNGCETTPVDVVVDQPSQLVSEAVQSQDYECGQFGQITVGTTPITTIPTSGGSGNYQYSINSGPWTASTTLGHTFIDLVDGTYSVQVRDANEVTCVITLADVVITPLPVEPTFSDAITYNCDGTGEVTLTPFDTNYTYILDGSLPGQTGAGANLFSNVSVGNHTITVDYGSGCTVDVPVTVADGNAFEATVIDFENLDCNGDNSGTITITAANFDVAYEYSLDGGTSFIGPFTSAEQITGLNAQVHSIIVRDTNTSVAAGCPITLSQELTEPDPLVASASITSPLTCNNGATITASAVDGTPNYIYQLEDNLGVVIGAFDFATNGNNNVFPNLPAGDYIVVARDKNGAAGFCEDPIDTAISLVNPTSPTFTVTPTPCYSGANDGEILVAIDAGSLPGNGGFEFRIDSGSGPGPWMVPTPATATTYTFDNLANGSYDVEVRDAFGCAAPQQTITINPQITANAVLDQDLTCLVDASITINANGGSGTFSYEWANNALGPWNTSGFTSNVFTTNTDGTYFFRATDTTAPIACQVVTNSVLVTPAILPSITSVTPTNLNCNGDNSGALDIVFDSSLGLAPFLINVQNTTTATDYGTQTSGLPAGNYTVTLTDSKGCVDTETAVITEPDPINYTATSVPITCDTVGSTTNPGSITISGTTGGTAEYTYFLTANNGIPTQTHNTTPGTRDHTFNILNFGIYQIDIVDANGCASFSTEIIASPPNDLDIDVSTATANCAAGGTAIVTVGAAVGSGDYSFAILETFTSPYSSTYFAPDVPGGPTHTFNNLTPGITYTFVVFDNVTMCHYFETADAPIDSPSNMTSAIDVVANVTCTGSADGNVSFTFDNYDIGATAVHWEIYNSQSNVSTGQFGDPAVNPPTGAIPISNAGTLPPGEYYLLLSEVNGAFAGCTVFGGNFSIRESVNLLDVNPVVTKNDNCELNAGVITATGQFGTAPYEYQFLATGSTAPTIATWAGTSNNVHSAEGGTYDVYIKDANNCIQTESIVLPTDPSPEISLAVVDECLPQGTYQVVVTLDVAGTTPYSLSLNGAPFQNVTFNGSNEYTISNLSSGTGQTVEIQDLNGCGESETFDIQPPLQFNRTVTKLLDCQPGAAGNAQITIDVTTGSGNYQYEITGPINDGPALMPSNPFVWNLASTPGIYTITISDMDTSLPHCSISRDIEVFAPIEPNLIIDSSSNITCFGDNDGTISVSTTDNGTGPYTFEITSFDGAVASILPTSFTNTTAQFTGLAPTTTPSGYIVTVTANPATNNCSTPSNSILITEPAIVDVPITAVTIVPFACTTGNNGNFATISVSTTGPGSVTGGSGNYTRYVFIDAVTSAVLQDGTNNTYTETTFTGTNRDYEIVVYDDLGCSNSLAPTTVTIPGYDELLTVTTSYTVSCNPVADGEVTLTTTSTLNDATQFEYSIDNGSTWQTEVSASGNQNVFSGLNIGIHNFLVRHAITGCILPVSETIVDPNTFEIDIIDTTDVTCVGDANGTVAFNVTDPIGGYTGNYSWEIFNTQGTPANPADDGARVDFGTSASYGSNILPVGEYRISVSQDVAPGCINEIFFSIAEPTDPLSSDPPVITQITCVPTDNGVVEIVNAQGGWGDYRYLVFDTTTIPVPDTNDRAIYNTNPRFENLSAGTYQVWLIDANGCPLRLADAVLSNPNPITATLVLDTQNCDGLSGVLRVTGVGGGQGIPANYRYQLQVFNTTTSLFEDFRPIQNSLTFSGLGAGQYQVIVSDQWGCTGPSINTIDVLEPIVPSVTIVKAIDCTAGNNEGEITVTQTGGSGTFTYEVRYPGTALSDPADDTNATGVFTGLATPSLPYTFTIIDQVVPGCSETITETLEPAVHPEIRIDAFTDDTCNDATSNGTISVSVPNNGISPYTFRIIDGGGSSSVAPILPTSQTATTATFTGLTGAVGPGITYTIEVEGNNECVDTITRVITQPEPITNFNVPDGNFLCATGNNSNFAILAVDAGLAGGTNIFVNYIFTNTDTGIIVQQGPNDSYTETDYTGGNYSIQVFDENGCSATTTAAILPFDELLQPNLNVDMAIRCDNSGEDITIEAVGSLTNSTTNPANYEFRQLPGGTFQPTGQFTNLSVDNYVFEVRNINTGCVVSIAHTVSDPKVIEVTAIKMSDEECLNNGVDDGSISVEIMNYSGGYDYQLFDIDDNPIGGVVSSDTSIPLIISNLSGGGYYVRVTETDLGSSMCFDDSNAVTIIAPSAPISYTPEEEASVSCSNDQGVILIDPTGGTGLYNIELINTTTGQPPYVQNGVSAAQFTGLSEGVFTVTVTDAAGCVEPGNITLERPVNFLPAINTTPLTCFNGNNGEVIAQVPSGRNPSLTFSYEYALNTYDDLAGTNLIITSAYQSLPQFENRAAGFYSITIKDNFGCSFTSPIEEIVNPPQVVAQLIRTRALTCDTTLGVELELSATGGTGTYQYSEDNITWRPMTGSAIAIPNADIPGPLPAGTYRYYVRDAAGCTAVLSNEITEDPIIDLAFSTITDSDAIACNGSNTGRIVAQAEFGMGNYQYELYYNAIGGQPFSNATLQVTSQSLGEFSGLGVGFYFVRVTSGVDCELISAEIPITESPLLEVIDPNNFTDALCFGDENGTITVELTGGAGGYQYAISPNLDKFDTETTFSDLAPGDYTVIAQDQNGCRIILDYTISEPELLTATGVATPEVCAGDQDGTITLTIQGGMAPYSTRLSDEANFVQDRTDLTGLSAGGYIIFVRDANGCIADVGITIEPGANLNAMVEPVYDCTGDTPDNYVNITLEDPTVIGDVLYALDSTDAADMQLNPDFRNTAPGSHYIAIAHANGCIRTIGFEIQDFEPLTLSLEQSGINTITATAAGGLEDYTFYFDGINNGADNTYIISRTDTFVVRVVDANGCEVIANIEMEFIDIEIPNFFTPDGDGLNDEWTPRNQEGFPEILTIIFDRYGRELYRMTLNSPGWDGLYNQSELPTGDYWYVIKLRGANDDREFVGHFTLYR